VTASVTVGVYVLAVV
jgi:hypothetical protein